MDHSTCDIVYGLLQDRLEDQDGVIKGVEAAIEGLEDDLYKTRRRLEELQRHRKYTWDAMGHILIVRKALPEWTGPLTTFVVKPEELTHLESRSYPQ